MEPATKKFKQQFLNLKKANFASKLVDVKKKKKEIDQIKKKNFLSQIEKNDSKMLKTFKMEKLL